MFQALTARAVAAISAAFIGVLMVLLVLVWMGEAAAKRQNRDLRADLVTTNQAWGACKSELAQARTEIAGQNTKIGEWRDKAAAAEREADARVAQARQDAARYRTRAARLQAAQAQGPDRCVAAARLYVETISEDLK